MANVNSLSAVYNLTLGNVTTESAFPAKNPIGGSSAGYGAGTTRAFVAPPVSPAGAFDLFDGRPLGVFADLVLTAGASENITVKLYLNAGGNTNLTTFTNDVNFYSTSTVATGAAITAPLSIDVRLYWDSVGQAISGYLVNLYKGINATTAISGPTILNSGTAVSTSITTEQLAYGVGIFCTVLFGTSNASNAAVLKELSLYQI